MFGRANDAVFDRTEVGQRRSIRQVAFASFIGTAVEWYDFFVYGTAAALVFPKLFLALERQSGVIVADL
jgi:hypothetical protein